MFVTALLCVGIAALLGIASTVYYISLATSHGSGLITIEAFRNGAGLVIVSYVVALFFFIIGMILLLLKAPQP